MRSVNNVPLQRMEQVVARTASSISKTWKLGAADGGTATLFISPDIKVAAGPGAEPDPRRRRPGGDGRPENGRSPGIVLRRTGSGRIHRVHLVHQLADRRGRRHQAQRNVFFNLRSKRPGLVGQRKSIASPKPEVEPAEVCVRETYLTSRTWRSTRPTRTASTPDRSALATSVLLRWRASWKAPSWATAPA